MGKKPPSPNNRTWQDPRDATPPLPTGDMGPHSPDPDLAFERNKDNRSALPSLDPMGGLSESPGFTLEVGCWEETTITAHTSLVSARITKARTVLSFLPLDRVGDSGLGESAGTQAGLQTVKLKAWWQL